MPSPAPQETSVLSSYIDSPQYYYILLIKSTQLTHLKHQPGDTARRHVRRQFGRVPRSPFARLRCSWSTGMTAVNAIICTGHRSDASRGHSSVPDEDGSISTAGCEDSRIGFAESGRFDRSGVTVEYAGVFECGFAYFPEAGSVVA